MENKTELDFKFREMVNVMAVVEKYVRKGKMFTSLDVVNKLFDKNFKNKNDIEKIIENKKILKLLVYFGLIMILSSVVALKILRILTKIVGLGVIFLGLIIMILTLITSII